MEPRVRSTTATGEILDSVRAGTPDRGQSPQAVEDTIHDVVQSLRERHDVRAVGIGARWSPEQ